VTIADLQAQVATSQANLQQSSTDLIEAQTALGVAQSNGSSQLEIGLAKAEVNTAANLHEQNQIQLNSDQAALDAAVAAAQQAQQPVPSPPPTIAPENSQAPEMTDPQNGETITNYATPSTFQLTAEAALKVGSTGLTGSLTAITSGVGIVVGNGVAHAVNTATGQMLINLGPVQPDGNTLPVGTLPTSSSDNTQALKVTISQQPSLSGDAAAALTNNQVVFDVMPTISETRDANYKSFTPIQHPGEILKYDGSSSRQWGVTARLISRTTKEADLNLAYINLIRSWTMPFYGTGTGTPNTQTTQYLGAPPPILTLTAYGRQMVGPVKCVLLQYQWTFPNEVDYIPTSGSVPFPVILDLSLNLKESYSPAEYSSFNLLQYRNGNLPAAFSGLTTSQVSALGKNNPASATQPISPLTPSNQNTLDLSQPTMATVGQVAGASKPQQAASTGATTATPVSTLESLAAGAAGGG